MEWTEVKFITTSEAVEAVSNIFIEAGSMGVAIEDALDLQNYEPSEFGEMVVLEDIDFIDEGAIVKAYFPKTIYLPEILPTIEERIKKLPEFGLTIGDSKLEYQTLEEADWQDAWKQYYQPVAISRFLTIVPEWLEYTPKHSDERVIKLDPGMAFGTGDHPTTRLSLQALEIITHGGETVLDVGTGSGVLSIAAKAFGANEVYAYDLDDVAVERAYSNINLNDYARDVQVAANDLLFGIETKADIIVANILADIIMNLWQDAYRLCKDGGHFIVSGIIEEKLPMILTAAKETGFVTEQILNQKDWYAIIFTKEK